MIEVKHLTKRYGSATAVEDLSFTVEKGQIYGFLGPNGAGKSTTMNIMTGYIAPSSGQVLINGHDILEDSEQARKCIGYLPEIPPVYPEMTALEYLTFVAELKKVPKKEKSKMIAEAMELTGITEVQNRLIRNLSKGFRQRVGLAQAILGYPEVIILDEPMVGLDPKQIIEIRELIKNLSRRHTIILSSHILSEISVICDHIMIISHGKLVASDTPENLTNLMKGEATLELTIRGNTEEALAFMRQFDTQFSYEIQDSEEENAVDISIRSEELEDVREMLFYALAESRIPLLKMVRSHVSLEEVFLELTGEKQTENPQEQMKRTLLPKFRKKAVREEKDDDGDI